MIRPAATYHRHAPTLRPGGYFCCGCRLQALAQIGRALTDSAGPGPEPLSLALADAQAVTRIGGNKKNQCGNHSE
jgi:hypothetical protein